MIKSIKDIYNSPDPCPYLCVPLKKYQQFFSEKFDASEGFAKVALTIAWIVTGIFAYPIFGLLAALGIAFKACCCKVDVLDPDVEEHNNQQIEGFKLAMNCLQEGTPSCHISLFKRAQIDLSDSSEFVGTTDNFFSVFGEGGVEIIRRIQGATALGEKRFVECEYDRNRGEEVTVRLYKAMTPT